MEKIIKIDLLNENDLIEKYDNDKLNLELLNYLLKYAQFISNKDYIKIVISNNCHSQINIKNLIKDALNEELVNTFKEHYKNNIIQIFLFFLGIALIFISTRIEDSIWSELFLIGGWVPIWEMIELEIFNDFRGRKKRKILNKLIKAEIEVINN